MTSVPDPLGYSPPNENSWRRHSKINFLGQVKEHGRPTDRHNYLTERMTAASFAVMLIMQSKDYIPNKSRDTVDNVYGE